LQIKKSAAGNKVKIGFYMESMCPVYNTLYFTATRCHTLQHAVTHCNALLHNATNCIICRACAQNQQYFHELIYMRRLYMHVFRLYMHMYTHVLSDDCALTRPP